MSWRCTFGAVLLLVGIILSPLHAVAATIPMLIAYDAAVRRSPTTSQVAHDGVRPEDEGPRINAYDCDAAVLLVYDDAPNLRVIAGAGGVHAYDRALELSERREVAWGPIYAAPAATPAAEGVALGEGEAAAAGMRAHHIFPQAEDLAAEFEARGLNIEEFRVQVSQETHVDLHTTSAARTGINGLGSGGLWNTSWRQFFAANPNAGVSEIFEHAAELLTRNNVPYYTPLH